MSAVAAFLPELVAGASALWGVFVGTAFATAVCVAAYDKFFARDPFYRRYPLFGRMLPFIDNWAGKFWRVHIDSPDRAGQPFNRAQIEGIKTLAEHKINKVPFGSTKDLSQPGTVIFDQSQFPPLSEDFAKAGSKIIGPYCEQPFEARSVFNISGMSYGSISKAAIEALSRGAAQAGCWLNTGEGGLSPYHLSGGADIVFQIGTAKYGVRDEQGNLSDEKLRELAAMKEIKAFEIKLAQGAKPGGGGILPGVKLTPEIAAIRGIEPWKDSVSPSRHKDAASMRELLAMVNHIRTVTGKPVGFKTVIGTTEELEEMCAIVKGKGEAYAPDFITLDGGEGGTGVAPQVLMDNVGRSIRETLPILSQILIKHDLRERIPVVAAGKLVTAGDVAWALAAGASFVNSARGFMFSMGCIMAMRCDKNTCPSGITTNVESSQKVLDPQDKGIKVANYHDGMIGGLRRLASARGLSDVRDLRPHHVNIVQADGRSRPMSEIYPSLKF